VDAHPSGRSSEACRAPTDSYQVAARETPSGMTGTSVWTKFSVLTLLFAVVLTVVLTPLIVATFRRRVTASMNRAADTGSTTSPTFSGQWVDRGAGAYGSASATSGAGSSGRWPAVPLAYGSRSLPRVSPGAPLRTSALQESLSRHAGRTVRRLALAYACGGVVQAVVITLVVLLAGDATYSRPLIWLSVLLVLSLPVVPTVATVLAIRPVVQALWVVGALAAALVLAADAGGLVADLFLLYVMVPATVLLLFTFRYWRATAPLVLLVALGGSLGWLVLLEIGKLVAGTGPAIWIFRLLGLAVGVLLAVPAVRLIGRWYRAKRVSEQMLFIDAWWSLLTLIQTTVLVATKGSLQLVALTGLAAYLLCSRVLLSGLRTDRPPAARLLLLRVFGHDRRTERLLDELTLRWRPIGTVDLIAGRDLALRNIDPSEFYAFLTGGLTREFVQGAADLRERLARRDDRQDPDGRFRVNQFFCHRDTWQPTLDRLVSGADAVLMDLRDFGQERVGCRYEIGRLAEHAGAKPIVLLVNGRTQIALAESIFFDAVPRYRHPAGPAGGVFVLPVGRSNRATVQSATRLLLGSRPA